MSLFVGFAAIGLVVAVAGVYGVTAFSVGQRRHEIGVRLALGATARDVIRLVAGRTVSIHCSVGAACWAWRAEGRLASPFATSCMASGPPIR